MKRKGFFNMEYKYFKNEYRYDDTMIKETQRAWWMHRMTGEYVRIVVLFVLSVAFFIYEPRWTVAGIAIISLMLFLLCEWKRNQLLNREIKQVKEQLGDNNIISVVVDKNVTIQSKIREFSVNFDNIDKILQTKNTIVLVVGYRTISLLKNGFKRGNCEDFIPYIKQVVRQEKKNKKIIRKKEKKQ